MQLILVVAIREPLHSISIVKTIQGFRRPAHRGRDLSVEPTAIIKEAWQ